MLTFQKELKPKNQKINESIESVQVELNDLVTGKFSVEQDHLQQLLQDKSQSLQEKYEQKLILELEKYKETLFEEFYLVSSDAIQRTLEQKKDLTEQQISENIILLITVVTTMVL